MEEKVKRAMEKYPTLDEKRLPSVFAYCDSVRDTGTINMFGIGTYLKDIFGFTTHESHLYAEAWMRS